MTRLMAALGVVAAVWIWRPFPPFSADPVADLIAINSPRLHAGIRMWHYVAPGVGVIMAWSVTVAVRRVWFPGPRRRRRVRGKLPPWPATAADSAPAVVVGEVHHPVDGREVSPAAVAHDPRAGPLHRHAHLRRGRLGQDLGLHAALRPPALRLAGSGLAQAQRGPGAGGQGRLLPSGARHPEGRRARRRLRRELGLGGRWQWNPLGDDQLDFYSLPYTVASLINQLFGRSKEPFWQQAYVNLVRWIIELHRMLPARWVTLRDVYRCTLDPQRIEKLIAEVETSVAPSAALRIRLADLAGGGVELKAWSWKPAGAGDVRTADDAALREKLTALEVGRKGAADPARRERLDAVRRWYRQDRTLTCGVSVRSPR